MENCKVRLEKLHPKMLKVQLPEMPQTQKKEVSIIMRKKKKQYKDRKYQEEKKESKKRVNYIEELEQRSPVKKREELETTQTHSSEPEIVLDPTGASTSSTMAVSTTSEEEWVALGDFGEFILPEELLESSDFNSMDDSIIWIKL